MGSSSFILLYYINMGFT